MMLAVSDITREVDQAFYIIGGICAVLWVAITAVLIYFAIKFNRKTTTTTEQFEGSLKLEITWIIIPVVIVLYMFWVGYKGFLKMRDVPPDAKVVQVVGQQWFWTFNYPDEKISSDRLVLPVNQAVKLELTAPIDDVVHSFYLPAFRNKEDVLPGQYTYLWIQPEKIDEYSIFCAEFCGKDHAKMISTLEVKSLEDYNKWVDMKIADINKPVDIKEALNPESEEIIQREGEKIFRTYCVACHGSKGIGGLVEGARNLTTLEDWKQGTKLTEMFRTLATGISGTQMRTFAHLPSYDRFAVVHYAAAFYQGTDRPVDTEEDQLALVEEFQLDKVWTPLAETSIEEAMKSLVDEAVIRN